jgi:zinc protease
MVNIKFTKQILDTEMTVVRNELERGENQPSSILRERVAATAYLWHNYGKSTIGSKEDLENVPYTRPMAFYKKYYQPDNAVLVVTGRIDEAKTLQFVADSLGKIPRPARVLDQTYTIEPPQDGERFVALRRVGEGQNVDVAYHAVSAGHPDSAALQVLAGIMNGSGRARRTRWWWWRRTGRTRRQRSERRQAHEIRGGYGAGAIGQHGVPGPARPGPGGVFPRR